MKPKPTRVAMYLRRSTDEQADSLDVQRARAADFIARQPAWRIGPEPYVDSGISRTEFSPAKRKGWFGLLEGARRGYFDAVVVRDLSRIGGNIGRALVFVEDLLDTGVKLFTYSDGQEVTANNAIQCVTNALKFFASQGEVEAIRSRTRDALETKAKKGLVTGGKVYGYNNRPSTEMVTTKNGERPAFVERVIDPKQAAVVRDIFARYAKGDGLRKIAKHLNAAGVPAPRGKEWVPAAIQVMLRRPLYIGRIEWGRTHKVDKGGSKTRTCTHDFELVVVAAEHLRIVSQQLWDAAHAKMRGRAPATTKKGGRPATYLLSGILRCGACGGPMTVIPGRDSYDTIKVYTCGRRRNRGGTACKATLRRDIAAVDAKVLDWAQEEVRKEAFITHVLGEVRRRFKARAKSQNGEVEALEKEAKKLRTEVDRFAEMALEAPSAAARAVFYDKVTERQTRLAQVEGRLRDVRTLPSAIDLEVRRIERDAKKHLADLAVLAKKKPVEAREFLSKLFPGGLTATAVDTAEGRRMRLEGTAAAENALKLDVATFASPARPITLPCVLVA